MSDKSQLSFVRTEDAPFMPPPRSEAGFTGWLYHNILVGMSDFSTIGGAIRSLIIGLFSLGVLIFGALQLWGLLDFALFSAVWTDPNNLKREVCWTVEQGGALPNGWHGACWPFIAIKLKFLGYGAYPAEELWRVNLTAIAGIIGLAYALIEGLPRRRLVGILMLTIYPLVAFILLTGGHFEVSYFWLSIYTLVSLALIMVGRLGSAGRLGASVNGLAPMIGIAGWGLIIYTAILAVMGVDAGLEPVDTRDWGGLLITLVVAITGIVASLPLGIVLALGRRSKMPVARLLCTLFIEFWRGVPLITVLFMASVMLPLFLPEGVNFDNLLRALIGVMLFSSAYMAEVVRGGLQAIDKGQYEGADAVGLSYWQSMRLVIMPQALTHVIPGIVNTFIGLFKDTTLVSIVGIFDLLGGVQSTMADAAWATPVQGLTGYLFVGLIFFIFCFGMSRYSIYMEHRLSRGHSK